AALVVMPVDDWANSPDCRILRTARHAREGKLVTGDNVQKSQQNCNRPRPTLKHSTAWLVQAPLTEESLPHARGGSDAGVLLRLPLTKPLRRPVGYLGVVQPDAALRAGR